MTFILLILIPIALGFWAQSKVSRTYNKYSQVRSQNGLTGREAAEYVLRSAGIHDVEIVPCRGRLSDHYDPTQKRLALSQDNYFGNSLAALGVAAHEAGHAIQHARNYGPLQMRMSLIPLTNIASKMLIPVMFGGFFFGLGPVLLKLGVVIYLVLTLFHLINLPVEFDASRRAVKQLSGLGMITAEERPGVVKTLNAAGFTYLAAFLASLGWLLYMWMGARD